MAVELRVLNGPLSRHRFLLAQDRAIIGRTDKSDIPLPVNGVSREHVELRIDGDTVTVRDLGSRNGSQINGKNLEGASPLRPGDHLTVCGCHLALCNPDLRNQVRLQSVAGFSVGREFPLSKEHFTIGRSNQADLCLPDKASSRINTVVERRGHGYVLKDNDSHNGTLLNGDSLKASTTLRSGDRFQVGETVFEFVDGRIEDLTGTVVGDYSLLRRVGGGTYGVVYEARSLAVGTRLAVKFFDPALSMDATEKLKLTNAIRNLGRIEHEHIIPIVGSGEYQDLQYLVMAWADNGSLADLITPDGDVPPPSVTLSLLLDAVQGLRAAAAKQIFHQALRPGNILITRDGMGWVTDFLTAQHYESDQDAGGIHPYFIAPEENEGQAANAASNQFNLGCIGYFALTGQLPFEKDDPSKTGTARMTEHLPAIEEFNQQVPRPLVRVIDRMMSRKVEQRYPDWDAVINDLREIVSHGDKACVESAAHSVISEKPRTHVPRRRAIHPVKGRGGVIEVTRRREQQAGSLGLIVVAVVLLALVIAVPFIGKALKRSRQQQVPPPVKQDAPRRTPDPDDRSGTTVPVPNPPTMPVPPVRPLATTVSLPIPRLVMSTRIGGAGDQQVTACSFAANGTIVISCGDNLSFTCGADGSGASVDGDPELAVAAPPVPGPPARPISLDTATGSFVLSTTADDALLRQAKLTGEGGRRFWGWSVQDVTDGTESLAGGALMANTYGLDLWAAPRRRIGVCCGTDGGNSTLLRHPRNLIQPNPALADAWIGTLQGPGLCLLVLEPAGDPIYATFIPDARRRMAHDQAGRVFLTGCVEAPGISPQEAFSSQGGTAGLCVLGSDLKPLLNLRFGSGSSEEALTHVAVRDDVVVLGGSTDTEVLSPAQGATQNTAGGGRDAWVVIIHLDEARTP